jgi:hypothetical protein
MADYDYLPVSDGTNDAALMHITAVRAIGSTTIAVDTVRGVPAKFIGTSGTLLSTGLIDPSTVTNFKGHTAAGALQIDAFEPGSTDKGNTASQVVIIKPNTGWANRVASFIQNATGFGTPESHHVSALTVDGAITAAAQSLSGNALTNNSVNPLALKLPIAVRGYLTTDFVTATNVWTTCYLTAEYNNGFTQQGGGFIIPYTGLYLVNISMTHVDNPNGPNNGGQVVAGMYADGAVDQPGVQPGWYVRTSYSLNPTTLTASRTYQLGAGTHVYLKSYAGGNGQNYRCHASNANDSTTLELTYLGPTT